MSNKNHENKCLRIGMYIGKWVGGGVEAVVMNYYKNIDRNKIQFDFICDDDSTNIPYEEIEKLGGKVIIVPPYQKLIKFHKEFKRICKENNYKIVHSNANVLSVFPLFAAKYAGVPVRIAHSHSTTNRTEWKKNLLKQVLKPFSKVFANTYFACTEHAGRWLFGNKAFDKGKVLVVNNGIDVDSYSFNEKVRKEKRNELKLKDTDIVIGHIGRFVKQKNHEFLIDIFNELYKENNNYKLMLIGQGPLQDEMKQKVKDLGIEAAVMFLGQKNDANKYYQAMDLFLFPSLYEGLGMVFVEAQSAALPSVASTEVPVIAQVSDRACFIGLDQPIKVWTDKIKEVINQERKVDLKRVKDAGYDIVTEANKIQQKYIDLTK